jgi:predicted secreted protein
MAVISGIGGSVTFASGYVTAVRSWSITITSEALETTDMNPSGGYRTRIGGLKSWSGSYSAFIDGTVFASIDDQLGGTPSAATFALVSGSTEPNIQGTILITDVSVTANTDGPVEVEFTFEGSAEPTLSNT